MTNAYVAYPANRHMSVGSMQLQVSSQIAAGAAETILMRNQTGKVITAIFAQGWVTNAEAAGTSIDIQTGGVTMLNAPMNVGAALGAVVDGVIDVTNNTVADGATVSFIFTDGAGAQAMLDAQASLHYRVDFNAN